MGSGTLELVPQHHEFFLCFLPRALWLSIVCTSGVDTLHSMVDDLMYWVL